MEDPIQKLKELVWYRTFKNTDIAKKDHYYREITAKLCDCIVPANYGRPGFHWHTVRNFYEDFTKPTILTLELFATYALDSKEKISWRTFLHRSHQTVAESKTITVPSGGKGRWIIKLKVELPIIIELEESINEPKELSIQSQEDEPLS
jgi:hypothetical protein